MDNKPKKSKKKIKKVKPKKYYAIKKGRGVKNLIVESWSECSKLVLGYDSTYKSFLTREEAESFLVNVKSRNVKYEPVEQLNIFDSKENKNSIIIPIKKDIVKSKSNDKSKMRLLDVKISRKTYDDFRDKCEAMDMTMEKVIKGMIDEWID